MGPDSISYTVRASLWLSRGDALPSHSRERWSGNCFVHRRVRARYGIPGAAGGAGVAGGTGAADAPLLTRSFNSLLGLKKGIFLAGTSTRSPVFGLRPTRGLRWRVRKLPKPRISILSPTRSDRTTLSKIVSTITSLSFRVSSASRETSSIRSAFVIILFAPFRAAFLWDQRARRLCRPRLPITFSNLRGSVQVGKIG